MSVGLSVRPSAGPNFLGFFVENPVSQLWDLIETWGFREDLKPIVLHHDDSFNDDDDDDKEDDEDKEDDDNNDNNNNILKFKFLSFGT